MKKKQKIYKCAVDGEIVSAEYAKNNKDTTYALTVDSPAKKSKEVETEKKVEQN